MNDSVTTFSVDLNETSLNNFPLIFFNSISILTIIQLSSGFVHS